MKAPSPWIEKHISLIPATGQVLDVACGAGRHSIYLRDQGYPVIAVDVDTAAIATGDDTAGLSVVTADLEAGCWPFRTQSFAGIVVVNYLWRPLFSELIRTLQPGGVLLYDTFARGNERYGRPNNPDFLLNPGELQEAFGSFLEIIDFFEGDVGLPRPACRQMIAARKPL